MTQTTACCLLCISQTDAQHHLTVWCKCQTSNGNKRPCLFLHWELNKQTSESCKMEAPITCLHYTWCSYCLDKHKYYAPIKQHFTGLIVFWNHKAITWHFLKESYLMRNHAQKVTKYFSLVHNHRYISPLSFSNKQTISMTPKFGFCTHFRYINILHRASSYQCKTKQTQSLRIL